MAERLNFIVRLVDRVSGPSRRIAASLKATDKRFKKLAKSPAVKAVDKFAGGVLKAAGAAGVLTAAAGALVSGAIVKGAVSMGVFQEKTRKAFELLTGSVAGGDAAFSRVIDLSTMLGQGLEATSDQMKKLLAQQFSLEESTGLIKLVADLRAIGVEGEKADRVLTAITQIRAKGRLQAEEMLQLAEAGVSLELVMGELEKATGKTRDEVRKLQEAGKLGQDVALAAIEKAILKKVGKASAGEAAVDFADSTITGLVGRLGAARDSFFLRVATQAGASIQGLKGPIQKLTDFVSNVNVAPFGKFVGDAIEGLTRLVPLVIEFATGFARAFGEVGALKFDVDSGSLLKARDLGRSFAEVLGLMVEGLRLLGPVIDAITSPLGKFAIKAAVIGAVIVKIAMFIVAAIPVVQGFASTLAGLAPAVTAVIAGIKAAAAAVAVFVVQGLVFFATLSAIPLAIIAASVAALAALFIWRDEIFAWFDSINWSELGTKIVDGIVAGLTAAKDAAIGAVTGLGNALVGAAKGVLGIASPSAVFAELGRFSAMGFNQGLASVPPDAGSLTPSGADIAGGVAGMRGGSNVSITVAPRISVDGSRSPGDTADAIVQALTTQFADVLEQVAIEHGLSGA